MLNKRIIGSILTNGAKAIQSYQFNQYLPLGKPEIQAENLNRWGIDEILLLDIFATKMGREPNYNIVQKVAQNAFVPLTIGGGIRRIDQVHRLMESGADRVCINSSYRTNPQLLTQIASIYGTQSLVVAIDYRESESKFRIFNYEKHKDCDRNITELISNLELLGCGEILLQNINRDGTKKGFDLKFSRTAAEKSTIPVIVMGGAGKSDDFFEIFSQTEIAGAVAGNLLNQREHMVNQIKASLKDKIAIRSETLTQYENHEFDKNGFMVKMEEEALKKLFYLKIKKEVI